MEIKTKIRFQNYNLMQAIELAGYPSVTSFANDIGISLGTIFRYLGFKGYPKDKKIIKKFEQKLNVPYEYIFPPEYQIAVERGLGKKKEIVSEISLNAIENMSIPELLTYQTYEEQEAGLEKAIDEAMETLEPRERKVLEGRFGINCEEKTLRKIGKELANYGNPKKRKGIEPERVRQIQCKALRKLRHPIRNRKIRTFLPEGWASWTDLESIQKTFADIKDSVRKIMFKMVKEEKDLSGNRKEIIAKTIDDVIDKRKKDSFWWHVSETIELKKKLKKNIYIYTIEKEIDEYISFRNKIKSKRCVNAENVNTVRT